jgi:hypothetical protein
LAEKIAGEITLSQSPGDTLRKWRRNFGITQTDLSNHLGISPCLEWMRVAAAMFYALTRTCGATS